MRIFPDINALAIQLIDDHPGHPYVAEELVPALDGGHTLLMFGYLPLRVQWVLEDLDFSTVQARNSITSLLRYPMESVDVGPGIILNAYDISAKKHDDVYDCFYIAVARNANADKIVTNDSDFERLCEDEPFEYSNPVPSEILS